MMMFTLRSRLERQSELIQSAEAVERAFRSGIRETDIATAWKLVGYQARETVIAALREGLRSEIESGRKQLVEDMQVPIKIENA